MKNLTPHIKKKGTQNPKTEKGRAFFQWQEEQVQDCYTTKNIETEKKSRERGIGRGKKENL